MEEKKEIHQKLDKEDVEKWIRPMQNESREFKFYVLGLISGGMLVAVSFVMIFLLDVGRLPFMGGSLSSRENTRKLSAIEKLIDENYIGEIDEQEMADKMYYGVMSALGDRYATYYTAKQYSEHAANTEGAYVGVGFSMEQDSETMVTTIRSCYENSPAQQAGILPGDVLLMVNGTSVAELPLAEISDLVMEKETVQFQFEREGETYEVEVTLGTIEIQTVFSRLLADAMGYIQISEFKNNTPKQFEQAYQKLLGQNIKGLIIDVRENPGGLMSSVNDIARQILPEGLITYTENKQGERNEFLCEGETPIEIPLVVLMNENSASASEVLVGAIKDYEIGTLVGTKTFGKGIVQSSYVLDDGSAVKMTTAKYFSPKGVNFHGEGIEPQVEVAWEGEEVFEEPSQYNQLEQEAWCEADNQFAKAVEVLAQMIAEEE